MGTRKNAPANSKTRPGLAAAADTMPDDVAAELAKVCGTKNRMFNTNLFLRTVKTGWVIPYDGADPNAEDQLLQTSTLVAMKAFKAADPIEAMLAAQAVMLHNLAMEAGRRAHHPQQSPDIAGKLRKDAANLSRSMIEVCEALDRRRGKGPQRIVVERVQVAAGGQAIVGAVTTGTPLPASPLPPAAIGQGPAPMPTLHAEPVEAGVGEGS